MNMFVLLLALAATPSAEEILARYEAAVGEAALARTHESRVIRSTYHELSGTDGEVFEYHLAPDRYLQLLVLDDGASFRFGTNGKSIWNSAPHGVESNPAGKMPAITRDAVFNRHLKLRELYPSMRVVGPKDVAGKPAWHVEAKAADGEIEQFYFDVATGLLVRRTYAYVLPSGHRIPRDYIYEEYADFGGVRMPSRIRQFAPAAAIWNVVSVDHNTDLFEQMFEAPKCN
jgi:hypothetical protein